MRPVGYKITFQNRILTITPESDDFVPGFQNTDFGDGVLKKLTVSGKTIQLEVDQGYGSYKSFELGEPARLVVDFFKKAPGAPEEIETVPVETSRNAYTSSIYNS